MRQFGDGLSIRMRWSRARLRIVSQCTDDSDKLIGFVQFIDFLAHYTDNLLLCVQKIGSCGRGIAGQCTYLGLV